MPRLLCKLVPMIYLIYIAGIITYLTVIIPCDWIGFFLLLSLRGKSVFRTHIRG